MPRTMQEILDHADELAHRFEEHEPVDGEIHDATPLRALRAAVIERSRAERTVADRVGEARDAGLPWSVIGAYLGTSGEAARQRYGQSVKR
jgi:hypothetical protein